MFDRHDLLAALLIVGYVAGLLIFVWPVHTLGNYGVESDFYWGYGPQARAAFAGEVFFDKYHPPLYGWCIAATSCLIGRDLFQSATLLSILSAALILLLAYRLARHYFDATVAVWSVALCITSSVFVSHSWLANIHMPSAALTLLAVWGILKERWIVAAIAIVAACWLRWNNFALFLPMLFSKHRWKIGGAVMVGLAVLAWWSARYYGGVFYNMNVQQNVGLGLFAQTDASNLAPGLPPTVTALLLADPLRLIGNFITHIFMYASAILTLSLAVPIGVLAIGSLHKIRFDAYSLMLALYFLMLCTTPFGEQHLLIFIPFLAGLSAHTVVRCFAR